MKKLLFIFFVIFISCEKEFKELQRSYVISNFIELNDDLDYKLIYFCDKYDAFEHFYDIKGTILNEIGEQNRNNGAGFQRWKTKLLEWI